MTYALWVLAAILLAWLMVRLIRDAREDEREWQERADETAQTFEELRAQLDAIEQRVKGTL